MPRGPGGPFGGLDDPAAAQRPSGDPAAALAVAGGGLHAEADLLDRRAVARLAVRRDVRREPRQVRAAAAGPADGHDGAVAGRARRDALRPDAALPRRPRRRHATRAGRAAADGDRGPEASRGGPDGGRDRLAAGPRAVRAVPDGPLGAAGHAHPPRGCDGRLLLPDGPARAVQRPVPAPLGESQGRRAVQAPLPVGTRGPAVHEPALRDVSPLGWNAEWGRE